MKKTIIIVLITIIFVQIFSIKNNVYSQKLESYKDKEIYNILLIGTDGYGESTSRADSMIILTIDNKNKSLKLSSIARDTLVKIPGRGYDKLNHAFSYGGCDLLLRTINDNLDLGIKDYAMIDFKGFIDVINIINGVDVNIEEKEIEGLNKAINTCYRLNIENKGNNIEYIINSGNQVLNGYQALAYCRLRKIDDCFHRDERQRKVLKSLASKLSNVHVFNYPQLIQTILKYVKVNISPNKIFDLALKSKSLSNYEIKQLQFPYYKYREDDMIKSQYVIIWDKKENIEILHDFISN